MAMTLKQGDCLDVMASIPGDMVSTILTSPPYNMNLRISNGKYCSRQITKELTTKYVGFDDNLSMEDYYRFNEKVLTECLRISETTFYNVQFLTGNKPALFRLLGKFHKNIKEFIVWDKVNAQPAIRDGVLNSQFEAIIVLQNSSPEARRFPAAQFKRGTLSNVWAIKRGKRLSKVHGATFPEELADMVISNFTKSGDTVLDPFMGTGTTGVSCKKLGRNFIGIEISSEYCSMANDRINQTTKEFEQHGKG